MHNTRSEEITLNLKVKPATNGEGWSALVQGSDPDTQIRFKDLQTLVRYLQAVSESRPIRGLR